MKLLKRTLVCILLCTPSFSLVLAQEDPIIGRHYAPKITLLPHSQLEFENLWNPPTVADINGDGKDDVAFSQLSVDIDGPSVFYIWIANENGVLENVTLDLIEGMVPDADRGTRQILARDFNGDGQIDLFLESHGPEPDCNPPFTCFPGAQNELLLSNPEGKLVNLTATHLPRLTDFTHGSSVLDFDGDGDADLWVNNLGGNTLADIKFSLLLENDGQGVFSVAADLAMGAEQVPIAGLNGILPGLPDNGEWGNGSWSVALDANGDNETDISLGNAWQWYPSPSVCNEPCERNFLLMNDGEGHFNFHPTDSSPPLVMNASVQDGQVYDFNADGLDDQLLLIDLPEVVYYQILISNGDGTFRDETAARYPHDPMWPVSELQLHDLDGDGHKDLFRRVGLYAESTRNDIRINDGEGYFRRLEDDWVQTWFYWTVLDVDGDGGTDFLINDALGYTLAKMNLPYGAVLDGTQEDDRLIGGAHDNVYRGLGGDDVLDGGLGDDFLEGGPDDDQLIGGKGDDQLIGGKGHDRLIPGSGTDAIDGGSDRDTAEYDFPIDEAEILHGQTTLISSDENNSNDQVQATEYALFSDAATPLPTGEQTTIQSLNGVAGLWYDPDLDGEGFNVITASTGTVIFYYGFNAEGKRLWLISESLANGFAFEQVFDLQMYEADGGTFSQPAPFFRSLKRVGSSQGSIRWLWRWTFCSAWQRWSQGDLPDPVGGHHQCRLCGPDPGCAIGAGRSVV